jgi:hypothetical protein
MKMRREMSLVTSMLMAVLILTVGVFSQEIILDGVVIIKNQMKTLKGCLDGDCCNDVYGDMVFVTGKDSLTLYAYDYVYPERFNCVLGSDSILRCDSLYYLSPEGAYSCKTNECEEMHCGPFFDNQHYRLTGYYITRYHVKNETGVKNFKVSRYELIKDEK